MPLDPPIHLPKSSTRVDTASHQLLSTFLLNIIANDHKTLEEILQQKEKHLNISKNGIWRRLRPGRAPKEIVLKIKLLTTSEK